jgi:hypothetical protein
MSQRPVLFLLPIESGGGRPTMVRWLLLRAVSSFERQWNYDASYLREMIEA